MEKIRRYTLFFVLIFMPIILMACDYESNSPIGVYEHERVVKPILFDFDEYVELTTLTLEAGGRGSWVVGQKEEKVTWQANSEDIHIKRHLKRDIYRYSGIWNEDTIEIYHDKDGMFKNLRRGGKQIFKKKLN